MNLDALVSKINKLSKVVTSPYSACIGNRNADRSDQVHRLMISAWVRGPPLALASQNIPHDWRSCQ